MALSNIFNFESPTKESNPTVSAVPTNSSSDVLTATQTPTGTQNTGQVANPTPPMSNTPNDPNDLKTKRKIPLTFIILPGVIVVLFLLTAVMSIRQSEAKPTATPRATVEVYATPETTAAPNNSSKAGLVKKVKNGSSVTFYVTATSGDAVMMLKDESFKGDFEKYVNRKIIASGVFMPNINTIYVKSITEYDSSGNIVEPTEPPIVFPVTSPTPTPSGLPISSPISE